MLEQIKATVTVLDAWDKLALPPESRLLRCSPVRDDKKPSFSIYANGTRWKDHATGEGGDVVAFWQLVTGLPFPDAVRDMGAAFGIREDRLSIAHRAAKPVARTVQVAQPVDTEELVQPLPMPLAKHLAAWADRKGIKRSTLRRCVDAGELAMAHRSVAFVYDTGVKVRRDINDSHTAYWAVGRGAVPWGTPSGDVVHVCEGESDRMRLMGFTEDTVVSLPSASYRPDPVSCYKLGAFRTVFLWMDGDAAGAKGATEIKKLLDTHAPSCNVVIVDVPEGRDVCTMTEDQIVTCL